MYSFGIACRVVIEEGFIINEKVRKQTHTHTDTEVENIKKERKKNLIKIQKWHYERKVNELWVLLGS
jgi:hypothetical protein